MILTKKSKKVLKPLLDDLYEKYSTPDFIQSDPVQIPHMYDKRQDIEIAGFFAAVFAWGQRITIINKSKELLERMGDSPYEFIVNHSEKDLVNFMDFKHRTFQADDTLYFLHWLQTYYRDNDTLEDAFLHSNNNQFDSKSSLIHFHDLFFDDPLAPERTRKHVATPARKSTCKRLNMYLRWMVRPNDKGIDFGLWQRIPLSGLMIPLDLHVEKTARQLGLLKRKQRDWQAVEELTEALKAFDPEDPAKYDYALFGLSILEK